MSITLTNMREFIEDVLDRRGDVTVGGNPTRMIAELHGGEMVELTAFAPDASTYREPFYYNTIICLIVKSFRSIFINSSILS